LDFCRLDASDVKLPGSTAHRLLLFSIIIVTFVLSSALTVHLPKSLTQLQMFKNPTPKTLEFNLILSEKPKKERLFLQIFSDSKVRSFLGFKHSPLIFLLSLKKMGF
jgi:hypothetical protein